MIGDRAFDIVAARTNGLRAVGVLWGYGSERELREAGAERLCATPVELPAVIAQLSVQGS
jgi:phosphoglycolate phosphatase